jgi:hypothetical protein
MQLGDCLAEFFFEKRLTIEAAAAALKRGAQYVRALATGFVQPDEDTFDALCELLGKTRRQLATVRDWSIMESRQRLKRYCEQTGRTVDDMVFLAIKAAGPARMPGHIISEAEWDSLYKQAIGTQPELALEGPAVQPVQLSAVPQPTELTELPCNRCRNPNVPFALRCRVCGYWLTDE